MKEVEEIKQEFDRSLTEATDVLSDPYAAGHACSVVRELGHPIHLYGPYFFKIGGVPPAHREAVAQAIADVDRVAEQAHQAGDPWSDIPGPTVRVSIRVKSRSLCRMKQACSRPGPRSHDTPWANDRR